MIYGVEHGGVVFISLNAVVRNKTCGTVYASVTLYDSMTLILNSLSASLLLNIFLSFEVGIAHAIANFK